MTQQIDTTGNFTRVPQTMTWDFGALDRTFGIKLSAIITDLILFISRRKFGSNLFGDIFFTMEEFCLEFGHSRNNLQRTYKDIHGDHTKDGHCYDSLFEYAIYRAMKETVLFNFRTKNERHSRAVLIFNDVRVLYKQHGEQRNLRTYAIKFSAEMNSLLLRSYFLADHTDYTSLKAKELPQTGAYRKFYLQLIKYLNIIKGKHEKGEKLECTVSIDELCHVFQVSPKLPSDKKKLIRKYLVEISSLIENPKFSWEFDKNGTRYAYFVKFSCTKENLAYFDERQKASFFYRLLGAAQRQYANHFGAQIFRGGVLSDEDCLKAIDWYFSSHKGKEQYDNFLFIFKEVYGRPYAGEFGILPVLNEKEEG